MLENIKRKIVNFLKKILYYLYDRFENKFGFNSSYKRIQIYFSKIIILFVFLLHNGRDHDKLYV